MQENFNWGKDPDGDVGRKAPDRHESIFMAKTVLEITLPLVDGAGHRSDWFCPRSMFPFIPLADKKLGLRNEQLTVNSGSDRVVLLFLVSIGSIAPRRPLFTSNPNLGFHRTLSFHYQSSLPVFTISTLSSTFQRKIIL